MVYKSGQIFLPFCHNAFDRQTDGQSDRRSDGQTPFSSQIHAAIPCSAKKNRRYARLGQYQPNFHVKEDINTNHFLMDRWANECLTTLSPTVFTQINFVANWLQAKFDFTLKRLFCAFEPPSPCGGLGTT